MDKLDELINCINKRKEGRDSTAATYRDSNDLSALAELSSKENNLSRRYDVLDFISTQYESMGRFSVAALYRFEALKIYPCFSKHSLALIYNSSLPLLVSK